MKKGSSQHQIAAAQKSGNIQQTLKAAEERARKAKAELDAMVRATREQATQLELANREYAQILQAQEQKHDRPVTQEDAKVDLEGSILEKVLAESRATYHAHEKQLESKKRDEELLEWEQLQLEQVHQQVMLEQAIYHEHKHEDLAKEIQGAEYAEYLIALQAEETAANALQVEEDAALARLIQGNEAGYEAHYNAHMPRA